MTAMIIIDRAMFPHLGKALDLHRRWLRDQGMAMPRELTELADQVRQSVPTVAAVPIGDNGVLRVEDDDVPAETKMLTYKDCVKELNVCLTTVKRMAKDGRLPVHRIGRSVRIDPEDLDACKASLRTEGTTK